MPANPPSTPALASPVLTAPDKGDALVYLLWLVFMFANSPPLTAEPLKIWFDRPAADWNEALPIGNGRLGAMIFGGDAAEYLQLNDDTLYSGEPGDRDLPLNIAKDLAQVRQRLRAGEYAQVHEWVTKNWLGRAQNCYQPLGHLRLEFSSGGETKSYRRELDLTNAVARVTYEQGGVTFTREIFASHPAQAIIIRLRASKPGALNFSAKLDSPHPTAATSVLPGGRELDMRGQVPGFALRRDLRSVQAKGEAWKYPELFDRDGHPKPEIVSDAKLVAGVVRWGWTREAGTHARAVRRRHRRAGDAV